jgi:hypothetical protein
MKGGITVVPYTSPRFAEKLSGAASPALSATLQPLLRYSVLIENDSETSVLGYTLVWAAVDHDGMPFTEFRGMIDYVALRRLIPPGKISLATILGPSDSLSLDQQLVNSITREVQAFESRASLTISLDAVLFDDGTVIGNDTHKTLAEMRARIRAEYDLYSAIVAKADSGVGWPELQSWVKAISDAIPISGYRLDLGNDPFSAWYRYYRARLAGALVRGAKDWRASDTINSLRSMLRNKPYPEGLIR